MTYFSSTLYLNRLMHESSPKISTAGILDNLFDAGGWIWDHVKSLAGDKPISTVVSFIGGPLLMAIPGLGWMGIAVEIASALGFDWDNFWGTIRKGVSGLLDLINGNKEKGEPLPSENDLHNQIQAITQQAANASGKDTVDDNALASLAKKVHASDNVLPKSLGAESLKYLVRRAAFNKIAGAAKTRGLLSSIFVRIIPTIITKALSLLGYAAAGAAVAGGGYLAYKAVSAPKAGDSDSFSNVREDFDKEVLNPSLPADMTEINENGVGQVWMEQGSIDNIRQYLSNWILQCYPQFKSSIEKIENSPSFIQVENMFKARNKMATGLQVFSVPKPFERKIDIVSLIVKQYLAANKDPNATSQK